MSETLNKITHRDLKILILQGMVISYFFNLHTKNEYSIRKGLTFSLLMTALSLTYSAFA